MQDRTQPSDGKNSSYRVAADELQSYIERLEKLAVEKQELAAFQKDVFSEAKGRGYDTAILRLILRLRQRDPDEIREQDAVLQMYKEALGMS